MNWYVIIARFLKIINIEEIPSGPLALVATEDNIKSNTVSSLQKLIDALDNGSLMNRIASFDKGDWNIDIKLNML